MGAVCSPDRRGHGNSILKNEQQVFTLRTSQENTEEKCVKALEEVADWVFRTGGQSSKQ
jgi:hypothetical protein